MNTYLITPAFCKSKMLKQCLEHIYKTPPNVHQHVIIDNRYPVNKEQNRKDIQDLCEEYDCTYIDSGKDLGLHQGINNAANILGIQPTDYVIGHDPDDRASPCFVDAITAVMAEAPELAILAPAFWVIDWRKSQGVPFEVKTVAGHEIWIHPTIEMWNVAGWNWKFVHQMGGLHQPNEYYGGLEASIYPHMKKAGLRLAYMPHVRSDAVQLDRTDETLFDPEYRQWKDAHLAGFKGSFEEWLKIHAPLKIEGN